MSMFINHSLVRIVNLSSILFFFFLSLTAYYTMDSPLIVDFEVSNGDTNGIPFWLRDVFDRALDAAGLGNRLASDDAIANLVKVDPTQLIDKECAICYDKFQMEKSRG